MDKYGVENVFQIEEVKTKIKETTLEKYGVESFTQTDIFLEKREKTSLEKYGVSNHMKLDKFRNMFKGENSPVWKGGVKYHRHERATFEYNQWRREVFSRDKYTCQCCGDKSGKGHKVRLNAHHITNFKTDIENRYILDNGLTLCDKCHIKFHQIYSKKNNNLSQLQQFLSNHGKNVC